LTIKLTSGLLQQPPSVDCVSIAVDNADLPAELCRHIGKLLKDTWLTSAATSDQFGLLPLLKVAQQQFETLVGSLPQYIEAYEATDASGVSVRRYAVLCSPEGGLQDCLPQEVCQATRQTAAESSISAAASSRASHPIQSSSMASAVAAAAMLDADIAGAGTAAKGPEATAQPQKKSGNSNVADSAAPQVTDSAAPQQPGQPSAQLPHTSATRSNCAQFRAVSSMGAAPVRLQPTTGQQQSSLAAAAAANFAGATNRLSAAAKPFRPNRVADLTSDQSVQQQPAAGTQENHVAAASAQGPDDIQANRSCRVISPVGISGCSRVQSGGRGRGRGRGRGPGFASEHAHPQHKLLQQQQQQQVPSLLAQQDLQAVQRRYGRSFRLITQERSGQQQQRQQDAQEFSLMLQPTDPLWGAARGPLHVTGSLHLDRYLTAGALNLHLHPSRGVTAAELWVLQSCLQQEMDQHCAGRHRQLLSAVRWLENFCGAALEQYSQAQQAWAGQQELHPELQQQHRQHSQQTYQSSQQQQQQQSQQQQRCCRPLWATLLQFQPALPCSSMEIALPLEMLPGMSALRVMLQCCLIIHQLQHMFQPQLQQQQQYKNQKMKTRSSNKHLGLQTLA